MRSCSDSSASRAAIDSSDWIGAACYVGLMLARVDTRAHANAFDARCDRCLACAPRMLVPDLDTARAALAALGWELVHGTDLVWCMACARDAREVKRHTARGRRIGRRKRGR